MRWTPGNRSRNLEDRRGATGGGGGGGGGGGIKLGVGGMLVLIVLSYVFKTDLITPITGGGAGLSAPAQSAQQAPLNDPQEEKMVLFVSTVLDSAQATWMRSMGDYREAKLVLFRDVTPTACGTGQSAKARASA
jgi:predicted metalloprotease